MALSSTHLNPRTAARLADTVASLEVAVAAGLVPNTLFSDAKYVINRAVEESAEAFLKTGPHENGHHQSDWWLGAYHCNALVSGLVNVPAAIKRATKHGMKEYPAFLATLLPLAELLAAAKPLVKKRGELPVVKSAKRIADEANQMTCQICNRPIFAATGTIAHHGYERPGHGWQTASCMGAKELPWEVSREVVGRLVASLKRAKVQMLKDRAAVAAETVEVTHYYGVYDKTVGRTVPQALTFNRETFAAVKAENKKAMSGEFDNGAPAGFAGYKDRDLAKRDGAIKQIAADIAEFTKRYNGWKQTHERKGDQWVAL